MFEKLVLIVIALAVLVVITFFVFDMNKSPDVRKPGEEPVDDIPSPEWPDTEATTQRERYDRGG